MNLMDASISILVLPNLTIVQDNAKSHYHRTTARMERQKVALVDRILKNNKADPVWVPPRTSLLQEARWGETTAALPPAQNKSISATSRGASWNSLREALQPNTSDKERITTTSAESITPLPREKKPKMNPLPVPPQRKDTLSSHSDERSGSNHSINSSSGHTFASSSKGSQKQQQGTTTQGLVVVTSSSLHSQKSEDTISLDSHDLDLSSTSHGDDDDDECYSSSTTSELILQEACGTLQEVPPHPPCHKDLAATTTEEEEDALVDTTTSTTKSIVTYELSLFGEDDDDDDDEEEEDSESSILLSGHSSVVSLYESDSESDDDDEDSFFAQ